MVEYALRLPAAARIKPTCRAYSASGVDATKVRSWLRNAESGRLRGPRMRRRGCCKGGPCAGCSNRGGSAASQQCEHGHRRYVCRRGLCPARQLNAKDGYGYHTDDEILEVLRRAPPPRFGRRPWPMGMGTKGLALHHTMKRLAAQGSGLHLPSSLGR